MSPSCSAASAWRPPHWDLVAGFTGQEIERTLEQECANDFVHLKQGFTRINVKLKGRQKRKSTDEAPRWTKLL